MAHLIAVHGGMHGGMHGARRSFQHWGLALGHTPKLKLPRPQIGQVNAEALCKILAPARPTYDVATNTSSNTREPPRAAQST